MKNNKKEFSLDVMKTILRLYEDQNKVIITARIKSDKTDEEYLYKNGNIKKIRKDKTTQL